MAPKKRGTTAASAASSSSTAPSKRRSKLAREHDLTAAQEAEILEAFSLFCIAHPSASPNTAGASGGDVLRASDVRRCLLALGLRVAPADVPDMLETLDPERDGFVLFEHFVAYAAILLHERSAAAQDGAGGGGGGGGEQERREEVEAAYRLFTRGAKGPITVAHLRRVARELREEVDDDVLRDMVLEANGEQRTSAGVNRGVTVEEFEGVMRRAGVFG